jgi:hypothetical protein
MQTAFSESRSFSSSVLLKTSLIASSSMIKAFVTAGKEYLEVNIYDRLYLSIVCPLRETNNLRFLDGDADVVIFEYDNDDDE